MSLFCHRRVAAGAATASLLLGAAAWAGGGGPFQSADRNAVALPAEIVFPDPSGAVLPPSAANPLPMLPAGGDNTDASANAPPLAGLNLLGTIAAAPARRGFIIQVQDTSANCGGTGGNANGLPVVFDDGGSGTATVLTLTYATAKGGQGGSVSFAGMPHTGRIRYYGTAGCQVGAAQW